VRWPDGVRLALDDVGMNQYLTVRQDGAMRPR
jgi:hypothetical protein